MSQPAQDGCCDEGMDAAACLSFCMATSPAAAIAEPLLQRFDVSEAAISTPSVPYATVIAPPDVAPPKTSVS